MPVSLREYLTLLEAMGAGVADYSIDDFYYLSRSCLVKDETNLDRNPANFAPLTPLLFIEWSAYVYPQRTAVIHGARRFTWASASISFSE